MTDIPVAPEPDLNVPLDEGLFDRLDSIALALGGLQGAVDEERDVRAYEASVLESKFTTAKRARRRSNLAIVIALGAVVLGFVAQTYQVNRLRDAQDSQERDRIEILVAQCVNGNASRAAIEDRFHRYTEVLAAAGIPDTMPDAIARREALAAAVRNNFDATLPPQLAARDCSRDAVTTPTTLPPLQTTVKAG